MYDDGAVTRVPCDLCEQKSFELIAIRDRRRRPLHTVVCRECGLVRHWHVPTEQQLRTFYSQQYRQDYHGEETPSARRIMRAWENGQRICGQLARYLAPQARVLEVGAGIGCTVKVFEQHGFRASGIEPHRGFQSYAANRLHADVANRDLFDCHDIGDCDLVLLVHVIEHFRSPKAALEQIRSMLKPGGLLYMECPNLAAPFATRRRLFHFAHIHNFTPLTLDALAGRLGLERVAWIHSPTDPNLAGLWKHASTTSPGLYEGSYEATMAAIHRHNWLTYHLRPSYLTARATKLAGYLRERLFATKIVDRLMRDCASNSQSASKRHAA